MRKSILMPHGLMRRARLKRENSRTVLPRLIRMSFQQSIPWRVALQQSPPPLPLPRSSSTRNHPFANGIPANGNRPLRAVSHFLTQSKVPPVPEVPPKCPKCPFVSAFYRRLIDYLHSIFLVTVESQENSVPLPCSANT